MKKDLEKMFEDIKVYYCKGYVMNVEMIGIENGVIEFYCDNNVVFCKYNYVGYKILIYVLGKKGVCYLFECKDVNSKVFKYV